MLQAAAAISCAAGCSTASSSVFAKTARGVPAFQRGGAAQEAALGLVPQVVRPGNPPLYKYPARNAHSGHPPLPAHVPVTFCTVETDELFHAPPNSGGVTEAGEPNTTKPTDLGGTPARAVSLHGPSKQSRGGCGCRPDSVGVPRAAQPCKPGRAQNFC